MAPIRVDGAVPRHPGRWRRRSRHCGSSDAGATGKTHSGRNPWGWDTDPRSPGGGDAVQPAADQGEVDRGLGQDDLVVLAAAIVGLVALVGRQPALESGVARNHFALPCPVALGEAGRAPDGVGHDLAVPASAYLLEVFRHGAVAHVAGHTQAAKPGRRPGLDLDSADLTGNPCARHGTRPFAQDKTPWSVRHSSTAVSGLSLPGRRPRWIVKIRDQWIQDYVRNIINEIIRIIFGGSFGTRSRGKRTPNSGGGPRGPPEVFLTSYLGLLGLRTISVISTLSYDWVWSRYAWIASGPELNSAVS